MEKLTFYKFVDLCDYSYFRRCRSYIGEKLYNGYFYRLFGFRNGATVESLKSYSNVKIYNGRMDYAPEIKFIGVFIADSESKAKKRKKYYLTEVYNYGKNQSN